MYRFAKESADAMQLEIDKVVRDPIQAVNDREEARALSAEADEAADSEGDVQAAIENLHTLAGMRAVLQKSLETGGASTACLKSIQTYIRWGGFNTERGFTLSVENNDSAFIRMRNTNLAIESITKIIDDAWAFIKEYYEKITKWFREFYMKYFSQLGRAKNEIEHLLKETKRTKNTIYTGEEKFTNLQAIARLKIGGEVKPILSIPVFNSSFRALTTLLTQWGEDNVNALVPRLERFLEMPEVLPDELVISFINPDTSIFVETDFVGYSPSSKLVKTYGLPVTMPGDAIILGYFAADSRRVYTYEEIEEIASLVRIFMGTNQESTHKVVSEVSALTAQEVYDLLKILETLCDDALGADSVNIALNDSKRKLMKVVDKITESLRKNVGADKDGNVKHRFAKSAATRLQAIDKVCVLPFTQFSTTALSIILAGLDYCKFSLKQLNH